MRFTSRRCAALLLLLATAHAPQSHAYEALDFRTVGAPPEVHVLESAQLREQLDLDEETTERLDELLAEWKSDYLDKKKQMDVLPDDDHVSRRGWPPNRDRELAASIDHLLDDRQYRRFHTILALWNGGFNGSRAFRYDRHGDLQLSARQHRQLHDLNVQWVLRALPKLTGPFDFSRETRRTKRSVLVARIEAINMLEREHKLERDQGWDRILSAQQAKRWRQIALRKYFVSQGFSVLLYRYQTESERDGTRGGMLEDYFIPYFTGPADVINWTESQEEEVWAIIAEYEQEPLTKKPTNREGWKSWLQKEQKRKREYLRQIEGVMTEEQRQRWRAMLGEPHTALDEAIMR